MADYVCVTKTRDNKEVMTPAIQELFELLPPEGQRRVIESGRSPSINPLQDSGKKACLSALWKHEQKFLREQEDYLANRGFIKWLGDGILGTGKHNEVFEYSTAERILSDVPGIECARKVLDELWRAGLIDVLELMPDSYSGVGSIAGMLKAITVTPRGEFLLSEETQPALLVTPS